MNWRSGLDEFSSVLEGGNGTGMFGTEELRDGRLREELVFVAGKRMSGHMWWTRSRLLQAAASLTAALGDWSSRSIGASVLTGNEAKVKER